MNVKPKLLLMGIDSSTQFAVEYAKQQGIHTIITDYNSPERAPLKLLADEYWMLNVGDLDALEQRCREEHITGIYAGNHEFCLDMTFELCRRLGLPYYASDEGWATGRDKARFKRHCIECGMDTARWYPVDAGFSRDVMDTINYPVVVKPADASSQRGFSICYHEEELKAGYERALQFSESGQVIVEEYISGDEVDIIYYVHQGIPYLMCINDKLLTQVNKRMNQTLLPHQSRFYQEYVSSLTGSIERFVKRLQYLEGALFLQAIRRDGRFYFLEMGCRLDGIGCWVGTKANYGFSYLECMVQLAMGQEPDVDLSEIDFSPEGKHSATYFCWTRPGKIAAMTGHDVIENNPHVVVAMERFHVGDTIAKTDNLTQVGWYLEVIAESTQQLVEQIRQINEKLRLLDESGSSLMLPYTDYETIAAYY